jgi:hypothetical protein
MLSVVFLKQSAIMLNVILLIVIQVGVMFNLLLS